MHIFGSGRAAFLEFLRNLTPSVLMASISILLGIQLDFSRVEWTNWSTTMAFFVCALTALMSLFANISTFLERAFGPPLRLDRAIRRLKRRGHSNQRLLMALIVLTWRGQPMIFFEAIVVMLVIYAALFVGVASAISAATTALKNGLR